MSELTVRSSHGDYGIRVELGASAEAQGADVALIDPVVLDLLPHPPDAMIPVEASEANKTLATCETVLVEMNRIGLRRGGEIVAVGGGVVQDVATLASSLYMRGVPWTYVPTTLMAMADSCIGGKSSINAGGIKNLVGNFNPPRRVLVDPVFITGLPQKARVAGLAEAVKICFARGAASLAVFLDSSAATEPGADEATAALIAHVLASKTWFIEVDEFDQAERQLLNFGHSFGHAWEASCDFAVPHGVGVAVGMLAALAHPSSRSSESTDLLRAYTRAIADTVRNDIASAAARTDGALFRRALAADKKNSRSSLRLVLPGAGGALEIVERPLVDSELRIAEQALRSALEEVVS